MILREPEPKPIFFRFDILIYIYIYLFICASQTNSSVEAMLTCTYSMRATSVGGPSSCELKLAVLFNIGSTVTVASNEHLIVSVKSARRSFRGTVFYLQIVTCIIYTACNNSCLMTTFVPGMAAACNCETLAAFPRRNPWFACTSNCFH